MTVAVAPDLVACICRATTTARGVATVLDVVTDPLDGSLWVRLSSWPGASETRQALADHGLNARHAHDCRLQVTGWDPRLLRRRLATVLSGIDDLRAEWDATAELADYYYDQRAAAGEQPPDPADVLADVEVAMRRCVPIPHRAPRVEDVATLLELIDAAEDAYEQLITLHLEHAEATIARRPTQPGAT